MISVTSPSSASTDASPTPPRPMVTLPVDDVAVLLGLLDLLCPERQTDGDPVQALANRFRARLGTAITDAIESPTAFFA